MPDRTIAGIGPLGELFLLDPDAAGAAPDPLGNPEAEPRTPLQRAPITFTWPTWTGDGSAILVSTIEYGTPSGPPSQLLRYPYPGGDASVLYASPQATSLLGPRMPHYLNPSPDGQHVGVLTPTPLAGLTLIFLDAAGRGPGQAVARGAPLFSAWSGASDALLLHVGGELSLLELATAPSTRVFATSHIGYRVPAWSPDGGRFAIAGPDGSSVRLQVLDRGGTPRQSLVPSWTGAAFAWSPDGALIAHARLVREDTVRYADLSLVKVDGTGSLAVNCPGCLAFVWSPDGAYLAALLPATREGQVCWLICDRDGRPVRRFPAFDPSPEFSVFVGFFDQYALSHRLWSPDSGSLLAFGRMQLNGTPPELLGSSIYLHDVHTGAVRSLAAGTVAFWSPKWRS